MARLPKISVKKHFPSGTLVCSAVTHTHYVTHSYMGYTKREAQQLFREYLRERLKERQ